MMVEKGMQERRELSSWSSNRRQPTVGIAPVFWKLKTCPQWYNSSNNSTPSNTSQAVLQTEQQVFKYESMGAILSETTHLCIAAYIGVPGPDFQPSSFDWPRNPKLIYPWPLRCLTEGFLCFMKNLSLCLYPLCQGPSSWAYVPMLADLEIFFV